MFFIKALLEEANRFKDILNEYEVISGQKINVEKSEICFSRTIPEDIKADVAEIFGIHQVEIHSRYLGLPLLMGQRRSEAFKGVLEKAWKRVSEWKCKFLSTAGSEILIKAVIQALPVYMMTVYNLPDKSIQELIRIILKFWWDKRSNKGII
ncbi:hypothetical protein QQ045_029770 [Rhodiola kirilowii]